MDLLSVLLSLHANPESRLTAFDAPPPNTSNFDSTRLDSFGMSVLALFMLFTTENYEMVYETWEQHPASIVYFISVTVFFIFLTATFLTSIHNSFRQYRSVQVGDEPLIST